MRCLDLCLLCYMICEVAIDFWIGILTTRDTLLYWSSGQYNSCLRIGKIIWLYFYIHEDYFYILIIDITTVCRKWHHWKRSWMNLVLFWPRWLQIAFNLQSSFFYVVVFLYLLVLYLHFQGMLFSLVELNHW